MSRRPTTAEIALSNDASRTLAELEERLTRLADDRDHRGVQLVYELLRGVHTGLKAAYQAFTANGPAVPPPYAMDDLEEALADARRALTPDVKP